MTKMIIPSLIAKSQKELNDRIYKVKNFKIFQLDIMDGKFVKNKSLMFNFKLPKNKKYEAHLMIKNPKLWIEKNHSKVQTIIFHAESLKKTKDVYDIIEFIKTKNRKVGIAINPKTSVNKIKQFLNFVDIVLVMTVHPGKYGSKFIPSTLKKVREIKKLNPKINIEVDGGIDPKTIKSAFNAGANRFIVGSYLQSNNKPNFYK